MIYKYILSISKITCGEPKMSSMRYDNQVAIVTGAGGGLGRTYALLLASKGAKVVVNDLGGSVSGETNTSTSDRPADKVVNEITSKGGIAVANYDSVEFGDKIVKTAMDNFGRVDIVVNNAGILRDKSFVKMTDADWDLIYKVHLIGTYTICKAVWPIMREQRFGRIVNVTSASGLYGNAGQSNYAAMKMAIVGLSTTLAKEGANRNIYTNVIAPVAGSRMTATVMPEELVNALKPEYVAPVVVALCHESCEENGSLFELGGGWVSKVRWQRSPGVKFPLQQDEYTPESVAEKWDEIGNFDNEADNTYPTTNNDAFPYIMENIEANKENLAKNTSNSTNQRNKVEKNEESTPESKLQSARLFLAMEQALQDEGSKLVEKINGSFRFLIENDTGCWLVNLKSNPPSIAIGDRKTKADVTLRLSDNDFVAIVEGNLNSQQAFMKGKLKIKGNMNLAMKLESLMKLAKKKMKSKL